MESMFRQQAVVSFSRHGVEALLGYLTDNIHCESVWERHLRLLIEVIPASDGKHPDRIVLQERRRKEERLESCGDPLCRIFFRNPKEVVHQPQIFDNGGIERIDELEKCFENVGGFSDLDDVESAIVRSVARWLRDGEGVPEGDRCDG